MRRLHWAAPILLVIVSASAHAAVAPKSPEALKKHSTHIVTGEVTDVATAIRTSKVERAVGIHKDAIHTITLDVTAVDKGDGVAVGDTITVELWKPSMRVPPLPGSQGHGPIPKKGDRVTFYIARIAGDVYKPIVPNGIAVHAPSLVTIEIGDLPIILSAPHGGADAVPDVPAREGEGVRRFVRTSDYRTQQLTELLADAIEKKLGKRPYIVAARFHRKYIDANRPAKDAYESDEAKPHYDAYHAALAAARADVTKRFGRGLLIDIHGQGTTPHVIYRGTQNGKTTKHLVEKYGRDSLIGGESLFGQIAARGITVIPPVDSDKNESPSYNGGYIVRTYGSADGGTIDAIQLELGRELRTEKNASDTADKLAAAIAAFAKQHLPAKESQPENVRVGVYRDKGTGASVNALLRALRSFDDVTIHEYTAADARAGKLPEVDVVIHPGGSGGGQGRHLGEKGRATVRDFVRDGGGFIGICAGAYLASADYTWSLNILDAKVLDRNHWARGKGTVAIALTDTGRRVLDTDKPQLDIYYGQGPLLAPAGRDDIDDYEVIATYKTEIAKNGAPKGVMVGTTAIAQGTFGKGRVICFSPHPESTEGLEHFVRLAIDEVKRSHAKSAPGQ